MLKRFISLEWKQFFRSPSFNTNLFLKIVLVFVLFWFIVSFLGFGFGAYYMIEELTTEDPLQFINAYLIFYIVTDLTIRYFLQTMPVLNIKPLMYLPIKRTTIVNYSIGKTAVSMFNLIHAFFFIPFSIALVVNGHPFIQVLFWHLAIFGLIYTNNFLTILINNKDTLFYSVAGILTVFAVLQYIGVFEISTVFAPVFNGFYNSWYLFLLPLIMAYLMYRYAFSYYRGQLYFDSGLQTNAKLVKSEDYAWLNRFGSMAKFLRNDIKLLLRNKRSRTTLLTSGLFLLYGLLFFTNAIEVYEGPFWRVFAGIFVSGGFLLTFGQFVPSWDSAYYQLMMSQNITYKDYLNSKWHLMLIGTAVSMVLTLFYFYFGWQAYAAVFVGGIYNIGVNGYLVLWAGAYIKTPIDLSKNNKAFGDKKAFNLKSILLSLPKIGLPIAIYSIGHYTLGEAFGFVLVAVSGLLGLVFKNKVFGIIERIYKTEKYKTIAAYKQN